ncbi:hypothetical protein Ndes2526B_g07315 [Nannochloris sp. 'desiccata']
MSPSWALKGPISFIGGGDAPKIIERESIEVQIVHHPNSYARHALLHPSTASTLGIKEGGSLSFISLADGSDCVVPVTVTANTSEGAIALTATQQYNLHAKEGTKLSIRKFTPPSDEPLSLVDIDLEVSLLPGTKSDSFFDGNDGEHEDEENRVKPYILDAAKLSQHFLKTYLGLIVAKNEACIFPLATFLENDPELKKTGKENSPPPSPPTAIDSHEAQLVLRVRACNTLDQDTVADTVGYHCYRGIITPETAIYITLLAQTNPNCTCTGTTSGTTLSLELINARLRPPPGTNEHLIDIHTNDGEYFPVHRKLLRPCIALTKPVRTPGCGVTAAVDVDTLTFDRVLIFLEAHVLNNPLPSFGIHLVPPLKEAAERLQLGSLVEWCEKRLGDSASRRKWHSYKEIEKRNRAGGEVLLIMDGMVFDVTNWLPEHPGGSTIIPSQAINIDSSRFFELYHASRESFIYLREFYIGEILPSDRDAVPRSDVEPSYDFLAQLRQWTKDFRLKEGQAAAAAENAQQAFKSF